MGVILEVKDLKKYFKTSKGLLHAVDGVSFEINEGETLGVVGESGCGKSTLGRTIIHLTNPTGGQILFNGRDITNLNKIQFRELLRDMQFIFQDPYSSLNPRMTVKQTIMEPLLISKMKKKEAEAEALRLMELVGLAERFEYSYPHELDGGRRQRIGIAKALALKPKFVICDEPVSALDVSIQAQILNLLQDLQESLKLTYIFITHDLSVVKHISNKIMVMYLGNMVEYADTERLFSNPSHPYTKALLSAVPSIKHRSIEDKELLQGEIASPINPKQGCRFAARCPIVTDVCTKKDPELKLIEDGHFAMCHLL